jgi:hypothetical protein
MANVLYSLGVAEYEMPFGVRRAPTSLIHFSQFPEQTPTFEEDADAYVKAKEAEIKT